LVIIYFFLVGFLRHQRDGKTVLPVRGEPIHSDGIKISEVRGPASLPGTCANCVLAIRGASKLARANRFKTRLPRLREAAAMAKANGYKVAMVFSVFFLFSALVSKVVITTMLEMRMRPVYGVKSGGSGYTPWRSPPNAVISTGKATIYILMKILIPVVLAALVLVGCDQQKSAIDDQKATTKTAIDQEKKAVDNAATAATKQAETDAEVEKAKIERNKLSAQAQLDADKVKADAKAEFEKAKVDATKP